MERMSRIEILALNVFVTTAICSIIIIFYSKSPESLHSSHRRDTPSGDTSRSLIDNFYTSSSMMKNDEQTYSDRMNTCVDPDELDRIVSSAKQIFIIAPAKASGTSLIKFGQKCSRNHLNLDSTKEEILEYIQKYAYPFKLLLSHVNMASHIIDLAETMDSTSTLMIYMYRNELDRLESSIRFMANTDMCGLDHWSDHRHQLFLDKYALRYSDFPMEESIIASEERKECTIDESLLLAVIERREAELHTGSISRLLTCNVYDTFKTSGTNIMFIHYTQVNKVQEIMAKHLCPDLIESGIVPLHFNAASEKSTTMYVHSKKSGKTFELSEWVETKGRLLQWALGLNQNDGGVKCERQAYEIESEIDRCPSQMIRIPKFDY